jgi:hypothetical protein
MIKYGHRPKRGSTSASRSVPVAEITIFIVYTSPPAGVSRPGKSGVLPLFSFQLFDSSFYVLKVLF